MGRDRLGPLVREGVQVKGVAYGQGRGDNQSTAIQGSGRYSRASMTVLASVAAASVAALVSGCGGDVSAGASAKTLRVLRPPGSWVIDTRAWIPAPGVLTMAAATHPPYLDVTLFTVRIDGSGRWPKLAGLSEPNCNETAGIAPVALGRDRVAYDEDCVNPRLPPNKLKHIKEFSFRTHTVRSLFPYGLPFPARGFALRPDGRRGVLNDGTGLEEQLRWLQPRALSAPISLGLERVGQPAWSPDGRVIAVSAAVDVKGVEGVARSIASWRVYLGNSELRSVRPFGNEAFEEDPALAWSGDSRLLAVASLSRGANGQAATSATRWQGAHPQEGPLRRRRVDWAFHARRRACGRRRRTGRRVHRDS
jgi:hypothetical protein